MQWTWSPDHNDHYYCYYDTNGQVVYVWAKQQQTPSAKRVDSGSFDQSFTYNDNSVDAAFDQPVAQASFATQQTTQATPADPVSDEVRRRQPNFIAGTPYAGWYETLDSSYFMRTGSQARDFFRLGRVFAMLYTETASATARITSDDDAFTVVRLGEHAHTQIRRFVVVKVKRNFVYACAISTYRNQGTFKNGCDPTEHAVIYNVGVHPDTCYFLGEKVRMTKAPIQVVPADSSANLKKESRIRFGKIYSIEWNVKVKDIGMVCDVDLGTLVEHHNAEMR